MLRDTKPAEFSLFYLFCSRSLPSNKKTIQRLRFEAKQSAEELVRINEHLMQSRAMPVQSDSLHEQELKTLRLENRELLRLRNEVRQLRERMQGELLTENKRLNALISTIETRSSALQPARPPVPNIPPNSFIGVIFTASFTNQQYQGVTIHSVSADSAADEAQLQTPDVVLRIDGQAVTSVEQIIRTAGSHNPEDKLLFDFLRNGLPRQVGVVNRAPPEQWSRP